MGCCVYLPTDGCHVPGGRDKGREGDSDKRQCSVQVNAGGRGETGTRQGNSKQGEEGDHQSRQGTSYQRQSSYTLDLASNAVW